MSFGRGASGGGWLVANVCVRSSPITIGMQIDTPQRRPAITVAERLGFLEIVLRAMLIDLNYRRWRVAYNHVRQDCRAKRCYPHRPLPGGLEMRDFSSTINAGHACRSCESTATYSATTHRSCSSGRACRYSGTFKKNGSSGRCRLRETPRELTWTWTSRANSNETCRKQWPKALATLELGHRGSQGEGADAAGQELHLPQPPIDPSSRSSSSRRWSGSLPRRRRTPRSCSRCPPSST